MDDNSGKAPKQQRWLARSGKDACFRIFAKPKKIKGRVSQGDWVTSDGTWITPKRIWKAKDIEAGLDDYIEKARMQMEYWKWFDGELAKCKDEMRKYRVKREASEETLERYIREQEVVYPSRVNPFSYPGQTDTENENHEDSDDLRSPFEDDVHPEKDLEPHWSGMLSTDELEALFDNSHNEHPIISAPITSNYPPV